LDPGTSLAHEPETRATGEEVLGLFTPTVEETANSKASLERSD